MVISLVIMVKCRRKSPFKMLRTHIQQANTLKCIFGLQNGVPAFFFYLLFFFTCNVRRFINISNLSQKICICLWQIHIFCSSSLVALVREIAPFEIINLLPPPKGGRRFIISNVGYFPT